MRQTPSSFDDILGILHVKDLIPIWGQSESINLSSLLRPPFHVIESHRAVVAFQQFKQASRTLAIVLDEYGQVAGLITLEDMLEELVGDIAGEEESETIQRRQDGRATPLRSLIWMDSGSIKPWLRHRPYPPEAKTPKPGQKP